MTERVLFITLDDARRAVAALPDSAATKTGWTLPQVLIHCAQSIEYSLSGYPVHKPGWFKATIGRIALGRFLSRGYLSHGHDAAIPGAPELDSKASLEDARVRLLKAIDGFEAHEGALAPHFAYGPVEKADYAKVHAMHIADHWADLA